MIRFVAVFEDGVTITIAADNFAEAYTRLQAMKLDVHLRSLERQYD